jgi:predicted MFS family arabinose efflux permease
LIIAVAVGSAVAHLCTSALPFQIGALIDGYGLSAAQAGLVGFFQVGALAISMILFSRVAHRYRPTPLSLAGMASAAAANAAIYLLPPSLPLICLLGLIAGTSYGLILTAAVAGAASAANPDGVYAAGNSGSLLLIVMILSLLPLAGTYWGARGIFLGVALVIIACAPLIAGFRAQRRAPMDRERSTGMFLKAFPLLVIWSLFSLGTGGMWAFVERIGTGLGLSGSTIGGVLSASAFTGLIGTGLAALAAGRIPRIVSLGIGLVGGGATCLMFSGVYDLKSFAAAAVLYWVFTMFAYVMLLGTAASIDPTGRLGTLGTGCERLAFAIGAPVGGLLVDFGSTAAIGIGAAALCSIVTPLFLPAVKRLIDDAG